MQDKLSLYNRALVLLEGECLPDLTRERPSRIKLDAIWEQDRDALLREYQWNFATKRFLCSQAVAGAQVDGYALHLPSDFLRLKLDVAESNRPRHSIEVVEQTNLVTGAVTNVKALCCQKPQLQIRYVFRAGLELFDPLAFEALAAKMAVTFALSMSAKPERVGIAERHYMRALGHAKRVDATEGTKGTIQTSFSNRRSRSGMR